MAAILANGVLEKKMTNMCHRVIRSTFIQLHLLLIIYIGETATRKCILDFTFIAVLPV
jgi:hypothetical protein